MREIIKDLNGNILAISPDVNILWFINSKPSKTLDFNNEVGRKSLVRIYNRTEKRHKYQIFKCNT